MTIGEKLAALRRKNGMTQDGLAELPDVSRQAVSRWEIDAAFPETEKLIRLSSLFGCSIDFLLNNQAMKQKLIQRAGAAGMFSFCARMRILFSGDVCGRQTAHAANGVHLRGRHGALYSH